jgi:hypothetical protein
VQGANQPRIVWVIMDRLQPDIEFFGFQDNLGPADGNFAEAAVAEAGRRSLCAVSFPMIWT